MSAEHFHVTGMNGGRYGSQGATWAVIRRKAIVWYARRRRIPSATRGKSRTVTLTDAGRAYLAEMRATAADVS